jgi:hypothetical protein
MLSEALPHARLEDREIPLGMQPPAVDDADAAIVVVTIVDEPLILIDSAAHLTGIQQLSLEKPATRWTRRLQTLRWLVKLSGSKLLGRTTGIRLLVKARRLAPVPGNAPDS